MRGPGQEEGGVMPEGETQRRHTRILGALGIGYREVLMQAKRGGLLRLSGGDFIRRFATS